MQATSRVCAWSGAKKVPHDVAQRLEFPTHTQAKIFMDFWEARPADGILLGRDVPSRHIARLLSNILIWEPLADEADLVVWHAGEGVEHRFGSGIKGKRMSEMFASEDVDTHRRLICGAVETNAPVIFDSVLCSDMIELMHLEIVVLPVVAPQGAGIWPMAGLFYFR